MHDFTRATIRQALAAGLYLAVAAAPLVAQTHRAAVGLTGGFTRYGNLTPGLPSATVLEAGWTAGLQLEGWMGSRVGLRLNGAFAETPLSGAADSDYNVYSGDLGLLVRVLPGSPRAVAPFLSLAGGAVHYNSGGSEPLGGGAYGDDPVWRAMGVAGLGVDIGSRRVGLRIEVADQVIFPSIGESPGSSGLPRVHELRVQTALQLRMGGAPRATLAAAPAPDIRPIMPAPPEPAVEETAVSDPTESRLSEQDREIAELRERVDALEGALAEARTAPERAAEPLGEPARPVAAPSMEPLGMAVPEAGYTVQIGAYVEHDTAIRWKERLERRGLSVRLTEAVVDGQRVHRVRVGVLPSMADATVLARSLTREYHTPAWVDRIRGDERRLTTAGR